MTTTFETKVEILADFHDAYWDSGEFPEFFRRNDIGLPLAHFIAKGYIKDVTPDGAYWINHSFSQLMIQLLGEDEDKDIEFRSLEDLEKMF